MGTRRGRLDPEPRRLCPEAGNSRRHNHRCPSRRSRWFRRLHGRRTQYAPFQLAPKGPPLEPFRRGGKPTLSGARCDQVNLAQAFEVFDEIVGAGIAGSIHARRLDPGHMDFTITLSLADRTQEQLATLPAIVERYDFELDVDGHRLASLR